MKADCVWALLAVVALTGTGAAQNGPAPRAREPVSREPVPVEQEPHHHVVLKNGSVVVIHVILPAGESTLYHTHTRDRVSVGLSSTTITQQMLGQPEGKPHATHPGDVSALTAHGPYTHRIHNLGPATFEVVDVEFPRRPQHKSETDHPSEAEHLSGPVAAAIAAENRSARAYKWTLAPGASTPMHTHERPFLILAATPMLLKMTAPDGSSTTHEVKAGDFHWIDTKVTHRLTNAGTTEGQIVEIELK